MAVGKGVSLKWDAEENKDGSVFWATPPLVLQKLMTELFCAQPEDVLTWVNGAIWRLRTEELLSAAQGQVVAGVGACGAECQDCGGCSYSQCGECGGYLGLPPICEDCGGYLGDAGCQPCAPQQQAALLASAAGPNGITTGAQASLRDAEALQAACAAPRASTAIAHKETGTAMTAMEKKAPASGATTPSKRTSWGFGSSSTATTTSTAKEVQPRAGGRSFSPGEFFSAMWRSGDGGDKSSSGGGATQAGSLDAGRISIPAPAPGAGRISIPAPAPGAEVVNLGRVSIPSAAPGDPRPTSQENAGAFHIEEDEVTSPDNIPEKLGRPLVSAPKTLLTKQDDSTVDPFSYMNIRRQV
eukprot:TRINITY_DN57443_c0_g1_i1.p1 TRINITY_DN57443_c0_g1~~TRINITY_DN57443_c0_g1_i1.p1  ORF type:complete len:371 (+),score=71.39 TRINITY_DN57443_c0_g1_i1:47-1114(+)